MSAAPDPLRDCLMPRLEFRALSVAEHARSLHAMDNDPEVMRYINAAPPVPWEGFEEKIRQFVEVRIAALAPRLGWWAAHERASGAFVGWFHLFESRRFPPRLELGYRLVRDFWRRGYATEASRALLEYAFHRLDAPEVIALTLVRNAPSRGVLEKLGMRLEQEFTFPPEVCETWSEEERRGVLYRIGRGEFPVG